MPSFASRRPYAHSLEALEVRIAPAALVAAGGKSATYRDVDGDLVKVTVSLGTLTPGLFLTVAGGVGEQLQKLNLSAGGFDAANVTFTVTKAAGGDGLANVGHIDSTQHDLGAVIVKGDLGRINAGDDTTATNGLKSLTVRSMGRMGTSTQGAGGTLESEVKGPVGPLAVAGDFKEAYFRVFSGADPISGLSDDTGTIASITIGGSIIGGTGDDSGRIQSAETIGSLTVGGDIHGGFGSRSGSVFSNAGSDSVAIGRVTVKGSIIGAAGVYSGSIAAYGSVGMLTLAHNLEGGTGSSSGRIEVNFAKLTSASIGGSIIGGAGAESGVLTADAGSGALTIGHDVLGGAGPSSGAISSFSNPLGNVTIGGSLVGGAGASSGRIEAANLGAVKIAHDLKGGSAADAGKILSTGNFPELGGFGNLASLTIGGSLIGGTATNTGSIRTEGFLGPVKIAHDFTGGSITGSGTLDRSGSIVSVGRIVSVAIGGSIIAGTDSGDGFLAANATIRAGKDIGSLTVTGSIIGNTSGGTNISLVVISARGNEFAGAGLSVDSAIGKISVGGRVEFANFLAGYDTSLSPVNGDAQIGAVTVRGDWIASNLVAGAKNANSGNATFGNANDASINAGNPGIVAKIASITITGQVFGTPSPGSASDHFGFVAAQIGAIKIGGNTVLLATAPPANNVATGQTSDVTVHEL